MNSTIVSDSNHSYYSTFCSNDFLRMNYITYLTYCLRVIEILYIMFSALFLTAIGGDQGLFRYLPDLYVSNLDAHTVGVRPVL
jgi:hypothetical protein